MRISRNCFANFVADFRTTFVGVSRECRENFLVSRTSRELVAKFFNMLKNFMRIFSSKYFARLSFVRVSRSCRREILANLQCEILATLVQMSRDCRTTVARQSCENLATVGSSQVLFAGVPGVFSGGSPVFTPPTDWPVSYELK